MSALFSLSKSAQEAANATVDFYGALTGQELPHNFLNLAATLGHVSKDLNEPNGDASGAAVPAKKAAVKKEKRIVDPNAPKKPTTSYFSFAAERRRAIRTERERQGLPPLGNSEITLDIATRWNNLTDAQKEPWNKKYKEEMVQYTKDKEAYIKSKEAKFQPPTAAAAEPAEPAKATKSKATPKKAAPKPAPVKEVEEDDDLVVKVADDEDEDDEPETITPVQAPPPSTRKAKAASAVSETPSKSAKRKAKESAAAEPASTKKKEKKEKKARKSEALF